MTSTRYLYVFLALSVTPLAKATNFQTEDRYNPQHLPRFVTPSYIDATSRKLCTRSRAIPLTQGGSCCTLSTSSAMGTVPIAAPQGVLAPDLGFGAWPLPPCAKLLCAHWRLSWNIRLLLMCPPKRTLTFDNSGCDNWPVGNLTCVWGRPGRKPIEVVADYVRLGAVRFRQISSWR